jgi:hypothetical protein
MINKNKKRDLFLKKAKDKYDDDFDYSKVDYLNSETAVIILCKKHNILFSQTPVAHLRGTNACNMCIDRINTTEDFILKANSKHKKIYDYSISKYNSANVKIKILCREHGQFEQLPINHVKGQGCPQCAKLKTKKTLTKNTFIEKSKNKHGDKYDYSLVEYINNENKVKIICPEHGEFEQLASGHMRGKGCKICAINSTKRKLTKTKDEFIDVANKTHNNKYNYDVTEYINSITKVKITCPIHGVFEQLPYDHISKHGCNNCTTSVSSHEIEINNYINSMGVTTIQSSRSVITPNQLDIYIPSKKMAIEYNGLYWHSEEFLNLDYHLNKTIECNKIDINLIHIFEDEWLYKKEIVKSRLRNILGLTNKNIYARKCEIKEVIPKMGKIFLTDNHIQGNVNASIYIGLYFNNELVSLMTFNKPRLGFGKHYDGFELSRFCNKLNTSVIGGASKLFKHFIKTHNPKQVISYADRRWSQGDLYNKLGFVKSHVNKPNYSYIINGKRKNRFGFRKDVLIKEGFDKNKSEHEIMLERKIYRIYDCGTITYKYLTLNPSNY